MTKNHNDTNIKEKLRQALISTVKVISEDFRKDIEIKDEKATNEFDFIDLDSFSPNRVLTLLAKHSDGSSDEIICNHSYNDVQINWFKAGSALNLIRLNKK